MEILTIYGIKILATLVVFAVLLVLFFTQSATIKEGRDVGSELEKLGEPYRVFTNIVVRAEKGMMCVPFVAVSPYGVFVITVSDDAGKVRGRAGDREWEIKSRGKIETIYNPLWKNRQQVNALEKKLGSMKFIPVVVFTRAKLKTEFGPEVVPLNRLRNRILKFDNRVLSEKQIEATVQSLLK